MPSTPDLTLPGNPRYQPKSLRSYLGYDVNYKFLAELELALLDTLCEIGILPPATADNLTMEKRQSVLNITTTEVDERERTTGHDVRAWIELAREILGPELGRWLHILLTSYDGLDTARTLQYVTSYREVTMPDIAEVVTQMADLVEKYSDTLQIGRTHGQHALPITIGFWLATILNRITSIWVDMDRCATGLVGKISGAVGAYNAQVALGVTKKCGKRTFEERILKKLGLKPARVSTQIVPPEPLANFLFQHLLMTAAFAQLARDCRHLMRSEIGEVFEWFGNKQVGSSTMAHKRNPITFENIEGTHLRNMGEFAKVLPCLISEHQRDLVGSTVARDFPIMVVNLQIQLDRLLKVKEGSSFLQRIRFDTEACRNNFDMSSRFIMAEPLYISLQMAGYEDAHELVNRVLVPESKKTAGMPLIEIAWMLSKEKGYEKLSFALEAIPSDVRHLLHHPEKYVGAAKSIGLRTAKDSRKIRIKILDRNA